MTLTPGKATPKGAPKPKNPKPKADKPTAAKATTKPQDKAPVAPKEPKAAKPAPKTKEDAPKASRPSAEGNKTDIVVALLKRPIGAIIDEITKVTGWQKHSARAFITDRLRKKGHIVHTAKEEGRGHVYRIDPKAAPQPTEKATEEAI